MFFDKIEEIFQKNPFFANGIHVYNLDETSTSIVSKRSRKIIGERNQTEKQKRRKEDH